MEQEEEKLKIIKKSRHLPHTIHIWDDGSQVLPSTKTKTEKLLEKSIGEVGDVELGKSFLGHTRQSSYKEILTNIVLQTFYSKSPWGDLDLQIPPCHS